MPDETVIEDDTEVDDEALPVAHTTSPELRERDYDTAPDPVNTEEAESLDEVHSGAAYNRAVLGPAANDPTIVTAGDEGVPEPGPGPEDNVALDNATGNAMSQAAESGTAWPEPPMSDDFRTGELKARENLGVKTTFDMKAPGEEGEAVEGDEGADGAYDPGAHTVAEVLDYIAAHPDQEEAVIAAEEAGKGRAGILG